MKNVKVISCIISINEIFPSGISSRSSGTTPDLVEVEVDAPDPSPTAEEAENPSGLWEDEVDCEPRGWEDDCCWRGCCCL